jgi:ABC-type antimicrobial peptide transport system permease subunit
VITVIALGRASIATSEAELDKLVWVEAGSRKRWGLAAGTFFDDEHTDHAARVVVIGETVWRALFPDIDPIGERVRIQNLDFEVIGVLAAKHHIEPGSGDDFNIRHPEELLQAWIKTSYTLRLLLLLLASVSVTIGGIGVMNVTLASSRRRTE